MALVPAKESRHYKLACAWREEAQMHRDQVANNPTMDLFSRLALLQLASIQEKQAQKVFQAIEKYGPNAVVVE